MEIVSLRIEIFLSIELLEIASSQLKDEGAFLSEMYLHIYNARDVFCRVKNKKLSNQMRI